MHRPQTLALVGLAATTASATSIALFENYCQESLWLTINNAEAKQLHSGAANATSIVGQGNTVLVTKTSDVFNPSTPKLVIGTSSNQEVLYWSANAQDGDPFGQVGEHFNVTSSGPDDTGVEVSNVCQNATGPTTQVYSCHDSESVILTVFGCPFNAA